MRAAWAPGTLMPEGTRNREATGTRPSEGRTTLERLLREFSTGGSDVKDAWESPREGSTETVHSKAHTDKGQQGGLTAQR